MENQKKPHGNTGKICSNEKRQAIRIALTGKKRGPYSRAHRAAISAAKKGRSSPAIVAANNASGLARRGVHIDNGLRGRKLTDEHKAKIGAGGRGKKRTQEFCDRISRLRTGIKFTDAQREKLRIATTARWARGDVIAWRSKLEQSIEWLLKPLGFTVGFRFEFGASHPYDYGNRERRILIEVNGCYWHDHRCGMIRKRVKDAEQVRANDKRYAEQAEAAGFKLIVLWQCQEKEWPLILKQEQVI